MKFAPNLYKLLLGVVAVLMLIVIVLFLRRSFGLCGYPYPLENGEGIAVHSMQLLWRGELYTYIDGFPLSVANYPPLFFILTGLTLFDNPFMAGRVLSCISILSIGLLLFFSIRRLTADYAAAYFGALLFFLMPWVVKAGIICRVDMLGSALAMAGLFCFLHRNRKIHVIGCFFFLCSLYTKHSLIATPLAAFLITARYDWRYALKIFSILAGIGILIFFGLTIMTHGGFYRNLITYNVLAYEFPRLIGNMIMFARSWGLLWIVIVPCLMMPSFWQSPLSAYLVCGLLSIVLTGREGSSQHYFFEATMALCFAGGWTFHRMGHGKRGVVIRFGVVVFIVLSILHSRHIFGLYSVPKSRQYVDQLAVERVQAEKGPVLAQDTGLIIAAGKTVYVHPFAITTLIRRGMIEPDFLYDQLNRQFFSLIVLDSPLEKLDSMTLQLFTRAELAIIYRRYRQVTQFGTHYYYEPKQ